MDSDAKIENIAPQINLENVVCENKTIVDNEPSPINNNNVVESNLQESEAAGNEKISPSVENKQNGEIGSNLIVSNENKTETIENVNQVNDETIMKEILKEIPNEVTIQQNENNSLVNGQPIVEIVKEKEAGDQEKNKENMIEVTTKLNEINLEDNLTQAVTAIETSKVDEDVCPVVNNSTINTLENQKDTKINTIDRKDNIEIPSDVSGNELQSDEAIKSVIKNIIDALNPEIISKVPDLQPPEGYISDMEWKKRETALLVKIARLEEDISIKKEAMQIQLKMKCDENEIMKSKLKTLETELRAVCSKPNSKNGDMVTKIKKQHDDLLTKARGMIFEKTKMVKNQELKIEALTAQVASLKDMVSISKDMLNIRNMECKHLQDRMEAMDLRLQAEKERQNLAAKKLESGNKLNEELKKEYLKQVELFKNLKEKYEEKFVILERNQKDPKDASSSSNQE